MTTQHLHRTVRENVSVKTVSAVDFPLKLSQFVDVLSHLGIVNSNLK